MRVVVRHTKFYDWEPVPSDVTVTDADKASGRVKPAGRGGGWLMRVTKEPEGGTHTEIHVPEHQVVAKIIHDKCRPEGGRTLSRKQALAMYLSEHVLPHHAHRSWITGFEVHDDGPDEQLARAMLAEHVKSGSVPAEDVEAHLAAYKETADGAAHAAHLCAHFRVNTTKAVG